MVPQAHEFIRLNPKNPDRPVDWLWKRAVLINEGHFSGSSSFKLSKDLFNLFLRIKSFVKALNTSNKIEKLLGRYEDIYEVYYINQHAHTIKWALESYVVAGLSAQDIAIKLGYGEEGASTVELYEKIFFDCRSRLNHPHFVLEHLLGIKASGKFVATEDRLWKLFAWVGSKNGMGIALLDGYMLLDNMPDNIKRWYDTFIEHQLSRKTINAIIKHDAVYNPELLEMVKVHNDTRRLKVDIDQKLGEIDESSISKAKKQLVDAVSLSVVELNQVVDSPIELPKGAKLDLIEAQNAVDEAVNKKLIENKESKK